MSQANSIRYNKAKQVKNEERPPKSEASTLRVDQIGSDAWLTSGAAECQQCDVGTDREECQDDRNEAEDTSYVRERTGDIATANKAPRCPRNWAISLPSFGSHTFTEPSS